MQRYYILLKATGESGLPAWLPYRLKATSAELDCENGRISIRYCGCNLVPMIEPTSRTIGFVDAKQIMPVADEMRKSGYFKYCVRKMASGGRYYVIKDGRDGVHP